MKNLFAFVSGKKATFGAREKRKEADLRAIIARRGDEERHKMDSFVTGRGMGEN